MIHLQPHFRSLAEELLGAVEATPAATGWTQAALYVWYSDEGRQFSKIRATVAGRAVSVSTLYGNVIDLTLEIWTARGAAEFYGFVMSVNPRREVDVRLKYNPDLTADPEFAAD